MNTKEIDNMALTDEQRKRYDDYFAAPVPQQQNTNHAAPAAKAFTIASVFSFLGLPFKIVIFIFPNLLSIIYRVMI